MSAGGIKVEIPFRIWVPHPGGLRIRAPHGDFAQLRRTGGEENGVSKLGINLQQEVG